MSTKKDVIWDGEEKTLESMQEFGTATKENIDENGTLSLNTINGLVLVPKGSYLKLNQWGVLHVQSKYVQDALNGAAKLAEDTEPVAPVVIDRHTNPPKPEVVKPKKAVPKTAPKSVVKTDAKSVTKK